MRKVADQDLAGRFEFVVDPDADPVDVDQVVARFLLALVRKKSRSSSAPPASAVEFNSTPEAGKA